uniref:Homeobox domain-containing protein n=3 Tax=Ditylum brightwellii TaxID=49249 RepID=A0A7S4QF48_9STRA|mmetsp:Transcript_1340/g.1675  ORF Transcript_1340/g.1675 Transcript_1340/m.1675 type:complete len:450 (-) Transcript_1340:480-1829(-)
MTSSIETLAATEGPPSPNGNGQQRKAQRKSSSLPPKTVEYLKAWMMSPEHVAHPYPTEQEKAQIMANTGIELKQLTNWFVNNRKRYWKPRVEARLQQQAQAAAATPSSVVVVPARRGSGIMNGCDVSYNQDQQVLLQPAPAPTTAQDISCTQQIPQTIEGHMFHHFNHQQKIMSHFQQFQPEANEVSGGSSCDSDEDDQSTNTSTSSVQGTVVSYDAPVAESVSGVIDETNGIITRHEVVDLHILKPTLSNDGALPTVNDVTISPLTSNDGIVKSFPGCQVSYTYSSDVQNNGEMVQACRENEILRLKNHCLNIYIAECHFNGAASSLAPSTTEITAASETSQRIRTVSVGSSCGSVFLKPSDSRVRPRAEPSQESCADTSPEECPITEEKAAKRPRVHCVPPSPQPQRPVYYGENMEKWREACRNASHGYCQSLPSLEEASHMFGYST